MNTVRQTHIVGTGRDQALVHPVMAEVALLRDTAVRVISDGVIGAFLDAGLTPGAQLIVHHDNSVISFADGRFRAGIGTGRSIAVPAQVELKNKFRPIIDLPRTVFPNRNQLDPLSRPVFLLAGDLAGSAAPAQFFIDIDFEVSHGIALLWVVISFSLFVIGYLFDRYRIGLFISLKTEI
jgi:hypothetical protein